MKTKLALAREVLHRLEIAQDNRVLTKVEMWLKGELKCLCLSLSSLERTMARLRSESDNSKMGMLIPPSSTSKQLIGERKIPF